MFDLMNAFADWWYGGHADGPKIALRFFGIVLALNALRFVLLFFHYIKTGKLGDDDNYLMRKIHKLFSEPRRVLNTFIETHPAAICLDILAWMMFSIVLMVAGGAIPYLILIATPIILIVLLARYLRNRVELKEEFVDKLKGNR